MKQRVQKAIKISIMPAFFASACCITYPVLVMLGFYISESFFIENKWNIRIGGFFLLLVCLFFYFRSNGVRTISELKTNSSEVVFMTIYTILAFILAYYALTYYFSPILCSSLKLNSCGV